MDKIDKLYIQAENIKKAHKRKEATPKKTITVQSPDDRALTEYKRAKQLQRENIKRACRDIVSYHLLMKQARTTYKLMKLSNK